MRRYFWTITAVMVIKLSAATANAESTVYGAADEAGKALAIGMVDAWNRHDMKTFADFFSEDADFVNVIGLWWHNRLAILKEHEALHASRMKNSHLIAITTAVRVVRQDVAIVHVRWQLAGDTGIDNVLLPTRQGVLSFVTVRTDDKWPIVSAQNTDILALPNTPPSK